MANSGISRNGIFQKSNIPLPVWSITNSFQAREWWKNTPWLWSLKQMPRNTMWGCMLRLKTKIPTNLSFQSTAWRCDIQGAVSTFDICQKKSLIDFLTAIPRGVITVHNSEIELLFRLSRGRQMERDIVGLAQNKQVSPAVQQSHGAYGIKLSLFFVPNALYNLLKVTQKTVTSHEVASISWLGNT